MRAPSLRRRVLWSGVFVVTVALVLVGAALYVAMRSALRDDVKDRLMERVALVEALVDDLTPEQIVARLDDSGVPARAVLPGDDLETMAFRSLESGPMMRQSVGLDGAGRIEVVASLARIDRTLDDLLLLEALGTVFGVCLAALILLRSSERALRPLETVVSVARAIARGHSGERLLPDRVDTDIGRLAQAFDEMLDAEESALERARHSTRLNQQFLSDAAHQLRTPLAGIRASAELLTMSPTPEERDRLSHNLVVSTQRAGTLVDALLRMARIDQDAVPEGEPVDVVALCADEVERLRTLPSRVPVRLATDGVREEVVLDAPSMREAIGNVLDNACRYARSRVDVAVGVDEEQITISIEDDGPGMDEDQAERAFERFATFGRSDGAGLGLPIARGIVEAHGGDLRYEGRAFVMRLPLQRSAPADEAPAANGHTAPVTRERDGAGRS